MTVGQRIQEHRKKNGLSQEELGQRLLVSRQTVSLWETDQTLPTVDNLLLLKEIFGISVDELLGVEGKQEDDPPLEVYTFTYEKEPLKDYFKRQCRVAAVCLALLLVAAVGICVEEYALLPGILCGILLSLAFVVGRSLSRLKSTGKRLVDEYPETTVTASLYEEKLVLRSVCRGVLLWEKHMTFDKIEKVTKDTTYYQLYYGGKTHLIPLALFQKGEYDPETRLEALLKKYEEQSKRKKATGLLGVVSGILCGLSFLICVGMIGATVWILMAEDPRTALVWTMVPSVAISAGSLGLGIYLLGKNKKGWHNVIAGAIALYIALELCATLPDTIRWHERQQAAKEGEIADLGIELPPIDTVIQTYEGSGFIDGVAHFSTQEVFFKDESCKAFEKDLAEDPAWMTELPAELIPISVGTMEFHYLSIYNITTGEFNKLPEESGTYQFLRVAYLRGGFAVMDRYAIEYEAEPWE